MQSASQQFKKVLADLNETICSGARYWVDKKTLTEAWNTCQNGYWMAWWLFQYRGIPLREFYAIAPEAGVLTTECLSGSINQAEYAALLRQHYTATGSLRKLRQPKDSTMNRRSDRRNAVLNQIQQQPSYGITTSAIAFNLRDRFGEVPEASIRRDIQSLRQDGHNIAFALDGVYRMGASIALLTNPMVENAPTGDYNSHEAAI